MFSIIRKASGDERVAIVTARLGNMMAKGGTSVKEAIAKWHANNPDTDPKEAKIVKLYMQIPPIEKMDSSLTNLPACEMLSLSSNCIEKITNLNGLKNLKILSLGRNLIKNLTGIEAVSDTLEQLWISYNQIEKLKGITVLSKLQVLYMSNNNVKDWSEFMKIADLHKLKELIFVGNPLEEKHSSEGDWRDQVIRRLPKLSKLDGVPIVRQEEEEEQ